MITCSTVDIEELIKKSQVEEVINVSPAIAKKENRSTFEVFVDMLEEKGYVLISKDRLDELEDYEYRYKDCSE